MYIKVRATANAKKEEVEAITLNRLRISVRQKPLQNLANRRIIELVARHFRVPVKEVRIISGHQSPSKILSIPD